MRTRPCAGGVWGGMRASLAFLFLAKKIKFVKIFLFHVTLMLDHYLMQYWLFSIKDKKLGLGNREKTSGSFQSLKPGDKLHLLIIENFC